MGSTALPMLGSIATPTPASAPLGSGVGGSLLSPHQGPTRPFQGPQVPERLGLWPPTCRIIKSVFAAGIIVPISPVGSLGPDEATGFSRADMVNSFLVSCQPAREVGDGGLNQSLLGRDDGDGSGGGHRTEKCCGRHPPPAHLSSVPPRLPDRGAPG